MSIKYTVMHLNKIVLFSMLLVVSIILSYVESLLPFQVAYIGIKIGLANIVTLVAIYLLSYLHSLFIGLFRVTFLSYIFGNIVFFQLSIIGFLISFLVMAILLVILKPNINKIDERFITKICIVSIFGSVFHNISQIVVCYFILGRQLVIFNLLYILIPVAILTGLLVALLSIKILKVIKYKRFMLS